MRRANGTEFLMDGDKLIGINLGADYCAEHEWGIKGIMAALGFGGDEFGISRRTVKEVPGFLTFDAKRGLLALYRHWEDDAYKREQALDRIIVRELRFHGEWDKRARQGDQLSAAWDESTFAVRASGIHVARLKEIYDAMVVKDAAVWLGGGGAFKNAGLCIGIVSRVSEEHKRTMYEADKDRADLKQAADETGIEDVLQSADRRWFALSPRWKHFDEQTRYPVVFWLNPVDQRVNKSGWYTVEELREWAVGRGPVVECKAVR